LSHRWNTTLNFPLAFEPVAFLPRNGDRLRRTVVLGLKNFAFPCDFVYKLGLDGRGGPSDAFPPANVSNFLSLQGEAKLRLRIRADRHFLITGRIVHKKEGTELELSDYGST
jgi:hypothetical protein